MTLTDLFLIRISLPRLLQYGRICEEISIVRQWTDMLDNCPLWFHERVNNTNQTELNFMSQHRSLRAAATLGGKRNVLKRFERIELLKKRGQWKQGDRITGLRKTKKES